MPRLLDLTTPEKVAEFLARLRIYDEMNMVTAVMNEGVDQRTARRLVKEAMALADTQ